jgi:hypothetical protein
MWSGMMHCRGPAEPSRVVEPAVSSQEAITQPPDEEDLACLLETVSGRVQLQFGYRGCFGGSDNDLDLEVGPAVAWVSGRRWTGISTNQFTDRAPVTRQQGQAYLRRFVDALARPDETSDEWTTTKAFVRLTYWCGGRRSGPFMLETNVPSQEDEDAFFAAFKGMRYVGQPHHHPYSSVHATIAVAQTVLERHDP